MIPTSDLAIPPLLAPHSPAAGWMAVTALCSVDLQQKQTDITYVSYQGYSEEQGEEKRWWECWTRLDRKETEKRERIAGRRKETENVLLKTSTMSQLKSSQPLLRQSLKNDRHLKTPKLANWQGEHTTPEGNLPMEMLKEIHLAGKVLSYGSSYCLSKRVSKNVCFNTLNQQVFFIELLWEQNSRAQDKPCSHLSWHWKPRKWARIFTTKAREAWKFLRSTIWVQFY